MSSSLVKIPTTNYIKLYWRGIQQGKYVVSKKVEKTVEYLVKLQDASPSKWRFNPRLANRPIWFIEHFCRQSKGRMGEPIKLDLWQKVIIQAIFGFVDSKGIRKHQEVLVKIGRKNGKSTLAAAISLYMLIGDKEGGPEIDCVSTKKDAAKIIFTEARNMVAQSPYLSKYVRKRKSDMYCAMNFGVFQPLSSDSNTLDGLNPSMVNNDEIHAWKDRNLYDVMKQAVTARRQPLIFNITTEGFVREGILDDLNDYAEDILNNVIRDDRFISFIYELDSEDEWVKEECWPKANPGLGTIKDPEQLRANVERAKSDKSFRPSVLTKDFNLKNIQAIAWLTWEELNNEETFDMEDVRDTYAIGGCDLSATIDLTCATLIIAKRGEPDKLYVLQHYFLPEERIKKLDETTSKEAPYRKWEKRGLMTICPGSMVNYSQVTEWFKQMRDEYDITMYKCGYDRALAGYWQEEMKAEFNESAMEKVAQGPFTWTQPMKELGARLADKELNYNNNPMLKWCLSNTSVKKTGTLDCIQPIKSRKNRRIDGMVSLLNAYTIFVKYKDEYLNLVG